MCLKYQEEVYAEYLKLKGSSIVLAEPKPAGLRDKVLELYKNGREDSADVIRHFTQNYTAAGAEIVRLDINKFKPVQHFLLGSTREPADRVVELVAWLIDFEPRPYSKWLIERVPSENEDEKGRRSKGKPKNNDSQSLATKVIVIVAAISLLSIYALVYWKPNTAIISAENKCMYWVKDRFVLIPCDQKDKSKNIIPFDSKKMGRLRMINVFDTLTKSSLGKVWYTKINGKPQFYTDSGFHPTDTLRKLKPLSIHILNTHTSYYRYLLTVVSSVIIMGFLVLLLYRFFYKTLSIS